MAIQKQIVDTPTKENAYKEIVGILGVSVLLYAASNYSNGWLLEIFKLEKPTDLIHFINRLLLWGCLLLLYLYTKSVEKQDLLLWKERKHSILFIILSVIVLLFIILVGFVLIVLLLNHLDFDATSQKTVADNQMFKKSIPLLVFQAFTAGVLEEIVSRGYVQPRVERLTKSQIWGILLSSLLFGIMHISYGTIHQVLIPIFFGLVFATFYSKYRSLITLIICHITWDLLSFFDIIS